ncbi:MAG TPA: hypothetical protein H9824_05690 [Candidatus Bacteroides pullicola]|uniref:Uncharacterized protein n=1 Tax=Candidatus Bacteroides pullicola TaxID=2838475 RepID=A0A9D2CL49_9BACE|nr:hypothetical protein [Candidatus Bacteroides pullicola]
MKGFIKRLVGLLLLLVTSPIIFISQPVSWLICGKTIPFVEKYMDWVDNKLLKL